MIGVVVPLVSGKGSVVGPFSDPAAASAWWGQSCRRPLSANFKWRLLPYREESP